MSAMVTRTGKPTAVPHSSVRRTVIPEILGVLVDNRERNV
ncbi:hypothetical protein Pd630_LPD04871 [Rhodococcus opacus PD630]|nr:hypothetical protein Pd630_LPD04871 [Rhodococcus opacus PD630]